MALTTQQIEQLNAVSNKANKTATDIANLNYAKTQGYTPGMVAIPGAQYNTAELQQANFSDIKPIGNTLYGIPKVPTSIPADSLTPPAPVTPVTPPTPTNPASFIEGLKTGNTKATDLSGIMSLESPATTEATTEVKSTTEKLMEKLQSLTGRSARTAELTQQAGIPEHQIS